MKYILVLLVSAIEMVFTVLDGILSTISGFFAILRCYLMRDYSYLRWLKNDLKNIDSILELGCGQNSPILRIGYGYKTDAVDIYQPYVDQHNAHHDYASCSCEDVLSMTFLPKEFDAVVMTDVLEHLPKAEAMILLGKIEQCARKKAILFTPNGFVKNDVADGNDYQSHLSGWTPEDFENRGYQVYGATGLKWILGEKSYPRWHPYSLWFIVAMLTMPIIYNRPEWGFHSYAVLEIK